MSQKILFSQQQIAQVVETTAAKINDFYFQKVLCEPQPVSPTPDETNFCAPQRAESVLVIGILKGAVFFLADLVRLLKFPVELDFIRVSSYGLERRSSQVFTLSKEPDATLAGRNVLLVEDIVDSGRTIQFLREYCQKRLAADVRVAALVDKPQQRQVETVVDFPGFIAQDDFLAGYGMDDAEKNRNLPYIIKID